MPCTLIAINSANCETTDGGIRETIFVDFDAIATVTWDVDDVISGVTTSTPGASKALVYDDNDTAYFNEVGERSNLKHIFKQEANMVFSGQNKDKRKATKAALDCCALVAFHIMNNGKIKVQGIEKVAGTPVTFRNTKKRLRLTASALSGTGAEEDRYEWKLMSESKEEAYFTSLTPTVIRAL